jgi:hypothetical protein
MALAHGAQEPLGVRDGLVLYLDAANARSYPRSGTTWFDRSGNGNNGTLVNGVGYNSANFGSLSFDGSNDYVQISRVVQDNFTLSCWFKTTQSFQIRVAAQWYNGAGLIDAEVAFNQNDFGLSIQAGKIDFGVGNPDTTIQSPLAYNNNVWHYAVGTRIRSTGQINLYVDGNFIISSTGNTNFLNTSPGIKIGAIQQGPSQFFNGNIAQVSIYNRALTAAEIQQNFNALRSRFSV